MVSVARFQHVGTRVSSVEHRTDLLEKTTSSNTDALTELSKRQKVLEQQLVMANKNAISREEVESDAFDRPPNREILKINTKRYVTKVSVQEAVEPWLAASGSGPDQYSLGGDSPNGKLFTIRFPFSALKVHSITSEIKMVNGRSSMLN